MDLAFWIGHNHLDWVTLWILSRRWDAKVAKKENMVWFGRILGWDLVGSEQVLGVGIPGEGCEGEDRQNSWINIAPSLPQPPTALIPFPSPNHYRQADEEESGFF